MSPEQCRRNGADCLKLARLVANPGDKMRLLHLADAWRRLAERAERQSAPKRGQRPAAQLRRLGPLK
jgi:hypothetical protein